MACLPLYLQETGNEAPQLSALDLSNLDRDDDLYFFLFGVPCEPHPDNPINTRRYLVCTLFQNAQDQQAPAKSSHLI